MSRWCCLLDPGNKLIRGGAAGPSRGEYSLKYYRRSRRQYRVVDVTLPDPGTTDRMSDSFSTISYGTLARADGAPGPLTDREAGCLDSG